MLHAVGGAHWRSPVRWPLSRGHIRWPHPLAPSAQVSVPSGANEVLCWLRLEKVHLTSCRFAPSLGTGHSCGVGADGNDPNDPLRQMGFQVKDVT